MATNEYENIRKSLFESKLDEFHKSLRCQLCRSNENDSYLNGTCDHLLCKNCLTNSNICAICGVSYLKRELHINNEIKEAISFLNKIIEITNDDNGNINTEEAANNDLINRNTQVQPEKDKSKEKDEKENRRSTRKSAGSAILFKPNSNATNNVASNANNDNNRKVAFEDTILDVSELNGNENVSNKKRQNNNKKQTNNNNSNKLMNLTQNTASRRNRRNEKGETPLHLAVIEGNYELCKQLLEEQCDPNARDYAGWTALHEACENGNLDLVKLLIEHNALINCKGFKDSTPLHECVLNDHIECVRYLLESGADLTVRNTHGFTAKDFATKNKDIYSLFEDESLINNERHLNRSLENKVAYNEENTQKHNTSFVLELSQFDTGGSTSVKKRRSDPAKSRRFVIFGTGMNDDDKISLNQMANKLDIKLQKEMSPTVTHVIFKDSHVCQRTINYMKAVLMGIWIVSIKWLEDSASAGRLLEENKYEATGSHKNPQSKGPFKGRMNACLQDPNLFNGCYFYFHGEFQVFNKNDLIQLVKQGEGTILRREPKLDRLDELIREKAFHAEKDGENELKCSHFLIYDVTKPRELVHHTYLHTVNVNWIFNCIDYFKVYVDNKKIK